MTERLGRSADIALGAAAVVVLMGAGFALTQPTPSAASTAAPIAFRSTPSTTPSPSRVVIATTAPARVAAGTVVVAGRDLAALGDRLFALTGLTVVPVEAGTSTVLASGALDGVTETPSSVVLEVLAGSQTSVRTRTAIETVEARWPGVAIFVVGPFSSEDRKSAAAVRTAAQTAGVVFLDPVELDWRPASTSAELSEDDLAAVSTGLAEALG